ncbi:acriflavin resistance protein [Desulfocarbo indianensis]|nr:acriflavin resistance protein [Desulfocarbo indianensis]
MRSLVRFVLHRTVLVNLVFIIFMMVGAFSLISVPVDRYPNVSMGKVYIETFFPGASPEEVEALVTNEIEEALDDLENVEFIRASSYRQRSSVVVKFLDDVDYKKGFDELRFKVLAILDELPPEVDPPKFNFLDVDDWLPVVSVNLVGDRSNRALALMAKEMKIALRQIPGVKEVELQGEQVNEFHVLLDPKKLIAYGITFDQAGQALQGANVIIPAGDFTSPGGEFVIQADERFRSRAQVMQTIVRTDADGSFVRMADLTADAFLTYRDPVILSSVNGQDCVALQVIKAKSGNALDIAEEVNRVLARFKDKIAQEGVKLVLTRDSTVFINESMRTLGSNMLLGIFLVCLVIWYFMGMRNAVITTLGIPFSFLFTMVFMWITGNSLNEITLFSFVLVSGIIVDDAIVVVENIYRHVQENEPLTQAIVDGTSEVALPVVAATATTVAAFLPMLIMTGSTGEFFALVPKAVTFAIIASLFECIFILPLHYRDWGPRKGQSKFDAENEDFSGENRVMSLIRRFTWGGLRWCLRHKGLSLGALAAAFLSALFIAVASFTGQIPLIKVKFFPDEYELYYVMVESPVGTPIEKTHLILQDIEKFIMADGPGMAESAQGYAGFYPSEDYEPIFGFNVGHVAVTLPARDDREFAENPSNDPQRHLDWMRRRITGRFARNGVTIKMRPELGGPPAGKDLNIRVVGPNPDSVASLTQEVWRFLHEQKDFKEGLADLDDGKGIPNRVLSFKVLPERAAEYGATPGQVVGLSSAVMSGRYLGKYRLVDEEVDLKLKLDPAAMREPADALTVPLLEHPSGPVRLGDLAQIAVYADSGQLDRFQGNRAMTITGNLKEGSDLSLPAVVERVNRFYRRVAAKHPGATLSFAGEFETTRKSFTSLGYAFVVAVMIMYLILATQFGSYTHPVIILSTVMFAVIGVIFGKIITQSLFTINSFIATVGLTGVVVNDALVLVDFLNKRYEIVGDRGLAIRQAVQIRLRPILLTTLTTTLGLLPMALGIPYYSVVWGTMASTFVTGLCTATFLTVLLVPVQWELLGRLSDWRGRRRAARAEKAPA